MAYYVTDEAITSFSIGYTTFRVNPLTCEVLGLKDGDGGVLVESGFLTITPPFDPLLSEYELELDEEE